MVVVLDITDYVAEHVRQLSDTQYYRLVNVDLTEKFADTIHMYLHSLYTRDIIMPPDGQTPHPTISS